MRQAGFTALPEYALDGDPWTFWSSTGGDVCCTDSRPAWLAVAPGAPRDVAALRLIFVFDMTLSVALANSSHGPWAAVGGRTCLVCMQNADYEEADFLPVRSDTFTLPAPVRATHARVLITWTQAGGRGGCSDLCDFASNVQEFEVWGPGALPPAIRAGQAAAAAELPPPPPSAPCAADHTVLVQQVPGAYVLTGSATASADGTAAALTHSSGGRGVSGALGALEFTRVVHSGIDMACFTSFVNPGLLLTVYVRVGGGVWPGEGLVISLVDASRQTPGATRFMPGGCGVARALPAYALSLVLDTADSDPACDAPGTGVRLVSTFAGPDAPPLVLTTVLDQSTAAFRRASSAGGAASMPSYSGGGGALDDEWVPVQALISSAVMPTHQVETRTPRRGVANSSGGPVMFDETAFAFTSALDASDALRILAPKRVFVNGDEYLQPDISMNLHIDELRASNASLADFYVVLAGAAGDAELSDAHGVARASLVLVRGFAATVTRDVVNWAGFRQPYTPPPTGNKYAIAWPPPSPLLFVPPQQRGWPARSALTAPQVGAVSFAIAFVAMLLASALVAWRARARRRRRDVALLPTRADQDAAAKGPDVAELGGASHDVFLSYRRDDRALADALCDKLRLAGVRAFKDVDGHLAGRPFDVELLLAVRAAPVFLPLVTLPSLQRMARASAPGAPPDTSLAEWLAALVFRDEEGPGARRIRPLLAGPLREQQGSLPARWDNLADDPAYAAALAAMPDVLPAATVALVDGAMRRALGRPLPARFAALSVRDIVCGGASGIDGVLSTRDGGAAPFALACETDALGLLLSLRYVPTLGLPHAGRGEGMMRARTTDLL